jgi:hypothetical protein
MRSKLRTLKTHGKININRNRTKNRNINRTRNKTRTGKIKSRYRHNSIKFLKGGSESKPEFSIEPYNGNKLSFKVTLTRGNIKTPWGLDISKKKNKIIKSPFPDQLYGTITHTISTPTKSTQARANPVNSLGTLIDYLNNNTTITLIIKYNFFYEISYNSNRHTPIKYRFLFNYFTGYIGKLTHFIHPKVMNPLRTIEDGKNIHKKLITIIESTKKPSIKMGGPQTMKDAWRASKSSGMFIKIDVIGHDIIRYNHITYPVYYGSPGTQIFDLNDNTPSCELSCQKKVNLIKELPYKPLETGIIRSRTGLTSLVTLKQANDPPNWGYETENKLITKVLQDQIAHKAGLKRLSTLETVFFMEGDTKKNYNYYLVKFDKNLDEQIHQFIINEPDISYVKIPINLLLSTDIGANGTILGELIYDEGVITASHIVYCYISNINNKETNNNTKELITELTKKNKTTLIVNKINYPVSSIVSSIQLNDFNDFNDSFKDSLKNIVSNEQSNKNTYTITNPYSKPLGIKLHLRGIIQIEPFSIAAQTKIPESHLVYKCINSINNINITDMTEPDIKEFLNTLPKETIPLNLQISTKIIPLSHESLYTIFKIITNKY